MALDGEEGSKERNTGLNFGQKTKGKEIYNKPKGIRYNSTQSYIQNLKKLKDEEMNWKLKSYSKSLPIKPDLTQGRSINMPTWSRELKIKLEENSKLDLNQAKIF